MNSSLKEEIKKLNYDIENRTIFKPNKLTILPLIQNRIINDTYEKEELCKLLDLNSKDIRKLKFYEMNEFFRDSGIIEEYLSNFTDIIISNLPKDCDLQSINFLLYEILINIYKHHVQKKYRLHILFKCTWNIL